MLTSPSTHARSTHILLTHPLLTHPLPDPALPVLTQAAVIDLLDSRFGTDPMAWAFTCPGCGDVATGTDIDAALTAHPRIRHDGSPTYVGDFLGQRCIGRVLGAVQAHEQHRPWAGRGCARTTFDDPPGPQMVLMPISGGGTRLVPSFAPAPPPSRSTR